MVRCNIKGAVGPQLTISEKGRIVKALAMLRLQGRVA
tara:strand:+ start:452 stop:562 length:111 start_codon:yes stop_codon:yes gene_type:complete